MSFLSKFMRKRDARRAAEAQQSPEGVVEQRKGIFGLPSRKAMPSKVMDMASQARANMPAAGATPMGGAGEMGGRFGTSDRGENTKNFKKGGMAKKKKPMAVKKMAKGGSASSASRRADGCATQGKTKGRFV